MSDNTEAAPEALADLMGIWKAGLLFGTLLREGFNVEPVYDGKGDYTTTLVITLAEQRYQTVTIRVEVLP